DKVQGLAVFSYSQKRNSRIQNGKPIIYVEFIEVAPWNQATVLYELGRLPKYRLVGTKLMVAAVDWSNRLGLDGRVGLRSLNQSLRFYVERCGMTLLAEQGSDIIGSSEPNDEDLGTEDSWDNNFGFPLHVESEETDDFDWDARLPYLEFTPEQAAAFVSRYG